ncbi:hypothetical protein EWB00_009239, partial [Schistosoma japonicum]
VMLLSSICLSDVFGISIIKPTNPSEVLKAVWETFNIIANYFLKLSEQLYPRPKQMPKTRLRTMEFSDSD